MIEIVFNDSAAGSLKLAQDYGKGKYCGGESDIISHSNGSKVTKPDIENAQRVLEKKESRACETAVPLGGDSMDVFNLNLAWSIGSISESIVGKERFTVLKRLYSICPEDVGNSVAEELYQSVIKSLAAVRNRAENGETLRMWYSNQPDEICGLYWIINTLKNWNQTSIRVFLVKLPEWETEEETVICHSGWGEVEPGKWHSYLDLQKIVQPALLHAIALRWSELQKENAPLRAVINGKLQSVPENYYDDFILREIALENNEFREANLIGRILGKYQLGIGDNWLALRIEEMIRIGTLEVVSSAQNHKMIYKRILKKHR